MDQPETVGRKYFEWNKEEDKDYDPRNDVIKFVSDSLMRMVEVESPSKIWSSANQLLFFLTKGKEGKGEIKPETLEAFYEKYYKKGEL